MHFGATKLCSPKTQIVAVTASAIREGAGKGGMLCRLVSYLSNLLFFLSFVMAWWWSVEGQDTGSGVSKMETTAGVRQQSGFICSAADNFLSTPKILTRTHR